MVSGLAAAGAQVGTFGIATTPCMFYSIVEGSGERGCVERCGKVGLSSRIAVARCSHVAVMLITLTASRMHYDET